jgi:hypothetical protein
MSVGLNKQPGLFRTPQQEGLYAVFRRIQMPDADVTLCD